MRIDRFDHLVLAVADLDASAAFYTRVLGMDLVTFGDGRTALHFGRNKINLHQAGREFEPKARHATPGSADLCLITDQPITEIVADLDLAGVSIEEGPAQRTGAIDAMISAYLRDPDGNLIEISQYAPDADAREGPLDSPP
jgi:catechol 2,3-dioxygenase-like lactoylglutathione lyase family enzyme